MKKLIAVGLLCNAALLSNHGQALALSDYNVIVAEDYNHASAVWGRTFVGGNVYSSGGEFATRQPRQPLEDNVKVVGDISGNSINIQSGNVVYGGELTAQINHNGGGSTIGGQAEALSAEKDTILNDLYSATSTYESLSANGDFGTNGNQATFEYTGNDSLAVFNVNAADVFTQNTLLQLDSGLAETVIINVSTAYEDDLVYDYDFYAPTGINFGEGFRADANDRNIGASNILWNFYDASILALNDLKVSGSVLAIYADILSIGTTDGSIAANSLIQDSQIHNYTFNTPSVVPLPASLQFMLIGMLGLVTFKRHFKNKAEKEVSIK